MPDDRAREELARLLHGNDPWAMHEFDEEGPSYLETADAILAAGWRPPRPQCMSVKHGPFGCECPCHDVEILPRYQCCGVIVGNRHFASCKNAPWGPVNADVEGGAS